MNFIKKILFLLPLLTVYLSAVSTEVKAGYFTFSDSTMRKVYNHGGYGFQASLSYAVKDPFELYGSLGYQRASGRSTHFHQQTTFWKIPVDLGLKAYFCSNSCLKWFGALGPRFFYAHQHNRSSYVNKHVSKSGLGLFAKVGMDYFITCQTYLSLFGEYSYERTCPSSSKEGTYRRGVQVGGYFVGGGVGCLF